MGEKATPLARQLAGAPAPLGPTDAFTRARRRFLEGNRIDMQALAGDLGISRATLFRWVGNRDQLLAEILWSMAEPTLRGIIAATPGAGGERLASIMGQFCRAQVDNPAFRAYLAREPEQGLRMVSRNTSLQRRFCQIVEELLTEEVEAGTLVPPLEIPDLAYLLVRVAETFTYTNLITGEPPSPEKAAAAVAALLR